jgi:hypothetical protein
MSTLQRVILTYPTVVKLTDTTDATTPRSWIQLARTGSFVSKRYGKFSIAREDLAQMLSNFTTITPKAPTPSIGTICPCRTRSSRATAPPPDG